MEAAEEFLITAAGQRNRNHLEQHVTFKDIPFGMQEVLFDPQTSGGLLMAVDAVDAEKCRENCWSRGFRQQSLEKSQSRQEPKFM